MKLLVSVRDAIEAQAAIDGGANIIDAKDPDGAALAPVTRAALREITAIVGSKPISAALGDLDAETPRRVDDVIGPLPLTFAKVGVGHGGGIGRAIAVRTQLSARGTAALVLAAYADRGPRVSLAIDMAERAGARGVLLDTADKTRGTLFDHLPLDRIADWIALAHTAGLLVAIAGSLGTKELPLVQSLGADIAGVRGAACESGRTGRVSAERVRELLRSCNVRNGPSPELAPKLAIHDA
jgi:(5-formylfuran-3-yl)methyl phosphate synthase